MVSPEKRTVLLSAHPQFVVVMIHETLERMRMIENSPRGALSRLDRKVHRANVQMPQSLEALYETDGLRDHTSGCSHVVVVSQGGGEFLVVKFEQL